MYQLVYPTFPACLRHSDAVHHPKTITSLGVLHNHVATDAVTAVHRYLLSVFRKKRLLNTEARAQYITGLFRSDDDHPIIWREYVEGNIQNHPEISGYKTTRRGIFQLDPILETLLGYYSSSGIKEDPPTEDPGPGNRPLGILALATAAVERAYKMYATGDFIESKQRFDAEFYNPRTARYMDYIANDLGEKQWDSIFGALSAFSKQTKKEEAVQNGAPEGPQERVPLPLSDPPSPCNN
ncbi:hypothetical protein BDM02DRAFT_3131744 [Thelephora ganbajun]|uniref:Uncharacterized protein n=1 Tax=Thelephora ganbajun TaxID=370292 RepID=A0ACB6Z402_THEGA|nr:hypothetical protein BDM02DRAFT_3131744 [Thelephora ganbajun]